MLKSGLTRTVLTEIRTPGIFLVSVRNVSPNSFCISLLILLCLVVSISNKSNGCNRKMFNLLLNVWCDNPTPKFYSKIICFFRCCQCFLNMADSLSVIMTDLVHWMNNNMVLGNLYIVYIISQSVVIYIMRYRRGAARAPAYKIFLFATFVRNWLFRNCIYKFSNPLLSIN